MALVTSCFAVGVALALTGGVLPGTGAMAAAVAFAVSCGCTAPRLWDMRSPSDARHLRSAPPGRAPHLDNAEVPPGMRPGWKATRGRRGQRVTAEDPDLYLDLDAVEVQAVYVLGAELFTHLRGGIGQRRDPLTGDQRHIEASDVALTWRCTGKRAAERLATQLNYWQAMRTPLRLLAVCGRRASLIEDEEHWVVLPELRFTR